MTNMEWLCQNPDKMVKIMHCPYRVVANVDPSLMSAIPGFGCIHPKGEITCDKCKMDWLKSPAGLSAPQKLRGCFIHHPADKEKE